MQEKIICISSPHTRTYYRAVAVAKEFLDKEQNIINSTGAIPDGAITEYNVSVATLKHLQNGQLHGSLQVINLTDDSITLQEEYKNGALLSVEETASEPTTDKTPNKPFFPGTTVKTTRGTRSFYSDGKEVAEETVSANGATVELLGNIPDGEVKEIDENGHVLAVLHYQKNKLNGECIRYNEAGKEISRENYKNGLLEGPAQYTSFTKNDVLTTLCSYKNSRLEGERTFTQQNGTLRRKEFYKNGHLDGARSSFYSNGKLESKENYVDGKLEGNREFFFPTGGLWYQENYSKGRLDGQRLGYFANGKLFLEEFYTDGLLEGPRKTYTENGELLSSEEYHWGALVHNTERKPL